MKKISTSDKNNHQYPPPDHILSDLRFSIELLDKNTAVAKAPILPEFLSDQGSMHVGIIATLVDVLGGALSFRAVYPDWAATSNLLVYTRAPASSGTLSAQAAVIRAGSTTIVIQVNIYIEIPGSDQPGKFIGSATLTFSRLPRKEYNLDSDLNKRSITQFGYNAESTGLSQPYLDKVGIKVVDDSAGIVELEMSNYIRNSFNALQGGAFALLADVAGQLTARRATGKAFITSDLSIHYLSQGKVGPFRTKSKVLRITEDTALSRIEVVDSGAENRLISVAMNTCVIVGKDV